VVKEEKKTENSEAGTEEKGEGSSITIKLPSMNTPKVNPWVVSTIILLLLSIVLYAMPQLFGNVGTTGAATAAGNTGGVDALSPEEAGEIAVDYINENIAQGGGVTFVDAEDIGGVYEVTTLYQDNTIDVYITLNGEQLLLIGQGGGLFDTTEPAPTAQPQEQPSTPEPPKSNKPDVKLFVMSYCPYGNVAEDAMRPVADLFGDKIDLKVHYIVSISGDQISALHGKAEADENIREACIQRDYDMATFWEFLTYTNEKCSLDNIDTCWEDAADATGVDKEAVEACFDADGLSLMEADTDLARTYSASGSPTLIINGALVSPARTPESYKQTICNAFNEPPEECSETLAGGSEAPPTGGC
jgi:hypothetical protein